MAKTKKKLNKKVLFVALASVVVGTASVVGVVQYTTRVDPVETSRLVDEAIASEDFLKARTLLEKVVGRTTQDPEWLLRFSRVVRHLTSFQADNLQLSRASIMQAITASPKNEAAVQEMVLFIQDLLTAQRSVDTYRDLRSYSDQLLSINPLNLIGQVAKAQVTAETLIAQGVTPARDEIDLAHRTLAQLRGDKPGDPDLIYYQSIAKQVDFSLLVRDATTRRDNALPEQAIAVRTEIEKLAAELETFGAADGQTSTNAKALSRAAELYQQLAFYYPGVDRAPQTKMIEAFGRISDAVLANLKDDEPTAYMILQSQFGLNRRFNRLPQAQAFAERGTKLFPADWLPRLNLADALASQGKNAEAVAALTAELPASTKLIGVRGSQHEQLRTAATADRARFRDDVIQTTPAGPEREALIALQQKDLEFMTSRLGESSPQVFMIRAGLEQARRDFNQALSSLSRAIDLSPPGSDDPRAAEARRQMQRRQAFLLIQLGQTGRAKEVLRDLVGRFPMDMQARMVLADAYLRDGEAGAAREQINELLKIDPNNAMGLRALVLASRDNPELRKATLDKLPELSAQDLAAKLQIALQSGEIAEGVRIGEDLLKLQPSDSTTVQMTAQAYAMSGQLPRALSLLDTFLAASPADQNAKLMRDQLAAQTPEERQRLQDRLLEQVTDPGQKLLIESAKARAAGDEETAIEKLKQADALPDSDGTAAERLLEVYANQKDWAQSQAMVDRLTKLNRDQAGGRLYRVRLLLSQAQLSGNLDEARKLRDQARVVAQEAVNLFPDFAGGHVALAQVLQYSTALTSDIRESREMLTQSVKSFDDALDRQPNNPLALRGAIEALLVTPERGTDAKPLIERGIRVSPNDEFYREAMLRWELEFGDPTRVIEPRQKQVEQFATNRATWRELARAYEASSQRARARLDAKAATDFAKQALDTYRRGLEKFPQDIEFARNFAALAISLGNAEEGIATFERVASVDPFKTDRNVVIARADLLSSVGKSAESINVLQTALTGKDDPAIRVRLAQAMLGAQRTDSALDVLRQGQDNSDVAQVLIETLTNLGRIDEAKKLVNDALAKSRTPVMLNQAGYVALRSNDPAGAIAMFEETLKASPKDVPALYFRALARRMTPGITVDQVLPDLQAAKAAMEESRKQGRSLASMEADVRLQIGSLLRQAGRSEDAIAELDAGTRVAPDDKRLVIELSRTFAQQTPPRWAKVDETLSLARQRPALVNDIDVIFEQADMSARRRDTARAVAASREAVALAPTNVQVLGKHQQILLSVDANREFIADSDRFPKEVLDQWNVRAGRALALLRTNNKTAADTELTTALKKADELTNPKDIRAARYLIAQSLSGAITSTGLAERFATDLQSDNAFRLLAVTQFLSESKPDQASGMADRVISDPAADPLEKAQAHALLGAYALTGPKVDLTVAATRYRQAIALNNLNIEYLNNLAYVLSLSENVEQRREGLTFAQQAFDLSAKASGTNAADPLIADTYGWLLILNDQVDEGMKVLNEALLRREIPEIMLHLAEGHLKKNQPIEAVRNLEKCLAFVSRVGNNARIDPGLRARVEDAQRRASEMLSRKAENSGR